MEHSSILRTSMASLDPASPLAPAYGRPGEDEAERKYSGLLLDNEYGTTLSLFNCTGTPVNEQSLYLEKGANRVILNGPTNRRGAVGRNPPATAASVHTVLNQHPPMMQLTGISRTRGHWNSGVLTAESDAPAQEGGRRQTGAHASFIPSLSHRSHLKGQAGIPPPADSSTPEGRRRENEAEEFFRLAQERKMQRLRLREQQQHQLAQQPEKWCRSVAEPRTHLQGGTFSVAFETPDAVVLPVCGTGSMRTHHDGDEDAATALNSLSMQLSLHTLRSSLILCSMTSLHHETPLQKSTMPVFRDRTQQQPQSPPKMDSRNICPPPQWEPLSAVPTMRNWEGEGFDYSCPFRQLFKDAYSSESGASKSSSYSGSESIQGEQREWMGVCPVRDFPYTRSPDWATLNALKCDSLKSQCLEFSVSEESAKGDQTLLFREVDRSGVSMRVPLPLAAATALPMTGDALCSHHSGMKAAARAPPHHSPPVSVTRPTNRAARVPRCGAPPPAAAAPFNRGVGKALITGTPCCSASANFAPASCSSSAHSSGSSTSSSRSLSIPKSRPEDAAVSPFSNQRRSGPLRVPSGDTTMWDDASSHGGLSSGAQRHADRLTTASLVVLPRKGAKRRWLDRFSAFKKMFHQKALL